ncbi:hypothetical protein [Streptomyces avermitilis]|uniref:hypothetical protein n=1 Tax=Streptomyces avermitilis TaxID=33903 RepID=UPI003F533DEA
MDVTDTALQAAQLLGAEGRSAEVRGARLAALQTALVKASAEEGFRRTLVFHHVVKEAEAFAAGRPSQRRRATVRRGPGAVPEDDRGQLAVIRSYSYGRRACSTA